MWSDLSLVINIVLIVVLIFVLLVLFLMIKNIIDRHLGVKGLKRSITIFVTYISLIVTLFLGFYSNYEINESKLSFNKLKLNFDEMIKIFLQTSDKVDISSPFYQNVYLNGYADNLTDDIVAITDPKYKIPYARIGSGTWYVYGRIQEKGMLSKSDLSIMNYDAKRSKNNASCFYGYGDDWIADARKNNIDVSSNNPEPGDIALWKSTQDNELEELYRLAFVEKVIKDKIIVTQSNLTMNDFQTYYMPKIFENVEFIIVTEDASNKKGENYGVYLYDDSNILSGLSYSMALNKGSIMRILETKEPKLESDPWWYYLQGENKDKDGNITPVRGWAKLEERRPTLIDKTFDKRPNSVNYETNFMGIDFKGRELGSGSPSKENKSSFDPKSVLYIHLAKYKKNK